MNDWKDVSHLMITVDYNQMVELRMDSHGGWSTVVLWKRAIVLKQKTIQFTSIFNFFKLDLRQYIFKRDPTYDIFLKRPIFLWLDVTAIGRRYEEDHPIYWRIIDTQTTNQTKSIYYLSFRPDDDVAFSVCGNDIIVVRRNAQQVNQVWHHCNNFELILIIVLVNICSLKDTWIFTWLHLRYCTDVC